MSDAAKPEPPRAEPEVRIDQLTGMRSILASGRDGRPGSFEPKIHDPDPGEEAGCPFCEGNELDTPPEVWANRPGGGDADGGGWVQRSVPNLYPALGADPGRGRRSDGDFTSGADPLRSSSRMAEPDLFGSLPASGAHEVIVNCPDHRTRLAELDEDELAGAVAAWRARVAAHAETASYVHLVLNEGPDAGASVEHSHAQLYALDFLPADIARERERFNAYNQRTLGSHLLEDVAVEEIRRAERLVAVDDEALLICPWASRAPYELRLIPRSAEPRFDQGTGGARMLGTALRALEGVFGRVPQLNLWIRTAPRGCEEFHWHLDLIPKLGVQASFELGTGVDINVRPPEAATADLREALA